ncbi:MAG TPA: TIGR03067 domain-containing protein [Gemmatales bacterium]|nr:TIGR03067 domain-containing protein [Gemmatales bacterium]HMP59663.1 TIGR03067 domain-containing protein [Gemmatales bacterium]
MRPSLLVGGLVLATFFVQVDDLDDLQGAWVVQSAVMAGRPVPAEISSRLRLEIKDKAYTVVTASGDSDKGKLELDAAVSPKRMKIIGEEGPNKGRTLGAIYEIKADTLKISYLMPRLDRRADKREDERPATEYPADFTSTRENRHFVVIYERSK